MSQKNGKLVRRYVDRYNAAVDARYAEEMKRHEQPERKKQLAQACVKERLREKEIKRVFAAMPPKDRAYQRVHMQRYLDHGGPK